MVPAVQVCGRITSSLTQRFPCFHLIKFFHKFALAWYCRLPRSCCRASPKAHCECLRFQSAAPALIVPRGLFRTFKAKAASKPHQLIARRRIGQPLRRMARRNRATPEALVIAFAAATLLVASGAFASSCALGCPHDSSPLRYGSARIHKAPASCVRGMASSRTHSGPVPAACAAPAKCDSCT